MRYYQIDFKSIEKPEINHIELELNDYDVVLKPNYNIKNPQTLEVDITKDYENNMEKVTLKLVRESRQQ